MHSWKSFKNKYLQNFRIFWENKKFRIKLNEDRCQVRSSRWQQMNRWWWSKWDVGFTQAGDLSKKTSTIMRVGKVKKLERLSRIANKPHQYQKCQRRYIRVYGLKNFMCKIEKTILQFLLKIRRWFSFILAGKSNILLN